MQILEMPHLAGFTVIIIMWNIKRALDRVVETNEEGASDEG